ncbi:MAG: hypothetical protein RQ867_10440 [Mariprofundaceae bacterium]|nr:hypothetical protein [Mariprofundaceae bacterium]
MALHLSKMWFAEFTVVLPESPEPACQLTSVAVGIGMPCMLPRLLHNKSWMLLPLLAWAMLTPSLSHAEVTVMKGAAAHGLVGSDGSRPVSLDVAQCEEVLRSIRYVRSDDPEPVFSDSQAQTLAPQLQQALAGVQPGEAVAFHEGKVLGAVFFSKDRLYWHFTHIKNRTPFQFTPLAEESRRFSRVVGPIPREDIDISYWKMAPQQGQSLHRGRQDMLSTPASGLAVSATAPAPAPVARQHARAQSRAVAVVANHDAEARIDTLHRLLGKGLITKDEYRGKLETVISEYETEYPSAEAGLEFLQTLSKKGQIEPDLLQRHRKKLLDRL